MKLKISEALKIEEVYNTIKTQMAPVSVSYKLSKIHNELNSGLKFYQEELKKIIDEYSQKDENGDYVYSEDKQSILIQDCFIDICNKKINDLSNFEIDFTQSFTIQELATFSLTVDQINSLYPIIVEKN